MSTATKKPPQTPRVTDRVLEALSTLAALLDRSINEVKSLDSEFQSRVLQAVHDTETSIQDQAAQHLENALNETRLKFEEQFKQKVAELTAHWDAEREKLIAELGRMNQTKVQWEGERARLNGELERLSRVQAATQIEAEKAIAGMKAASAAAATAKQAPPSNSEALSKEIERIEGQVSVITALIEDPSTELSTVIRKNVERAEMESYLKGIRFATNGNRSK